MTNDNEKFECREDNLIIESTLIVFLDAPVPFNNVLDFRI